MGFALPAGSWRYLSGGALIFTSIYSQTVLAKALLVFHEFGVNGPIRLRVAASPLWIAACVIALALAVVVAGTLTRRRQVGALILTSTTMLLLGASVFTFWSGFALSCQPFGEMCCLHAILP